jgi:hypothetical protein
MDQKERRRLRNLKWVFDTNLWENPFGLGILRSTLTEEGSEMIERIPVTLVSN